MDFKELVEQHYELPVTQAEIDEALPQAQRKLDWIISREGDLDGKRKEPTYLAILVGEIINMERFSRYCISKSEENRKAKIKESIQQNVEMLPQTTIIVSQ